MDNAADLVRGRFIAHRMLGRAASGGALARSRPRTTGVGPESPRILASPFPLYFVTFSEIGRLLILRSDIDKLCSISDW